MRMVTAAQAEDMVGEGWFVGYTDEVEFHEEHVAVDGFDAEARAEARGGPEFVVYGGGLSVNGTLDLGSDVHSIVAVRGELRTTRLILGDAVLVVQDKVDIGEWLFGPNTEGIFDVADEQIESDQHALLARIHAPVIAIFDRNSSEFVLRERGEPRGIGDLVPEVLNDDEVDEHALRQRLVAGEPIFG